eukprot:8020487-Pyramimonas_sp.AAC.1
MMIRQNAGHQPNILPRDHQAVLPVSKVDMPSNEEQCRGSKGIRNIAFKTEPPACARCSDSRSSQNISTSFSLSSGDPPAEEGPGR